MVHKILNRDYDDYVTKNSSHSSHSSLGLNIYTIINTQNRIAHLFLNSENNEEKQLFGQQNKLCMGDQQLHKLATKIYPSRYKCKCQKHQ